MSLPGRRAYSTLTAISVRSIMMTQLSWLLLVDLQFMLQAAHIGSFKHYFKIKTKKKRRIAPFPMIVKACPLTLGSLTELYYLTWCKLILTLSTEPRSPSTRWRSTVRRCFTNWWPGTATLFQPWTLAMSRSNSSSWLETERYGASVRTRSSTVSAQDLPVSAHW